MKHETQLDLRLFTLYECDSITCTVLHFTESSVGKFLETRRSVSSPKPPTL